MTNKKSVTVDTLYVVLAISCNRYFLYLKNKKISGFLFSEDVQSGMKRIKDKLFFFVLGDGVYIDSDEGYLLMAKINRIWTTKA